MDATKLKLPPKPTTTATQTEAYDLRVYMHTLRQNSYGVATALRERERERDQIHTGADTPFTIAQSTPLHRNPLSRAGQHVPTTTEADGTEFHAALELYAQRMPERALTKNGRALKGKATTKVDCSNIICYGSAYTRPAHDLLREVGGAETLREETVWDGEDREIVTRCRM